MWDNLKTISLLTIYIILSFVMLYHVTQLVIVGHQIDINKQERIRLEEELELNINTLAQVQNQIYTQMRRVQAHSNEIVILQNNLELPLYLVGRTGLEFKCCKTIVDECEDKEIPLDIMLGLIDYESDFNPECKNPKSTATGLGQFLHSTAKWVAGERGVEFSPEMLKDPIYNIKHTAWYLHYLYEVTGSWEKVLSCYGDQTESYPERVLSRSAIYRKEIKDVGGR